MKYALQHIINFLIPNHLATPAAHKINIKKLQLYAYSFVCKNSLLFQKPKKKKEFFLKIFWPISI